VNVTDNWLYLRSRSGPTYEGHISAFDGMRLRGQVSRHHNGGPRFAVLIDLLALKAGAVSGLVQAAPIEEGQPSGLGTAR
jgi:hypothetical protein